LDIHEYLFDNPDTASAPPDQLVRRFDVLAGSIRGKNLICVSFCRQLDIMRTAGDPAPFIDPLFGLIDSARIA
jgi:hypothetical protein